MARFTWDHIHLRSPNPEATAAFYERMFGAEVIRTMQQGKPRIDLKVGGANVFILPVVPGDKTNPPPTSPYQGLDHFGLAVTGIDAVVADLKAKGAEFTMEPNNIRPGIRIAFLRTRCTRAIATGDRARRGARWAISSPARARSSSSASGVNTGAYCFHLCLRTALERISWSSTCRSTCAAPNASVTAPPRSTSPRAEPH